MPVIKPSDLRAMGFQSVKKQDLEKQLEIETILREVFMGTVNNPDAPMNHKQNAALCVTVGTLRMKALEAMLGKLDPIRLDDKQVDPPAEEVVETPAD